MVIELKGKRQMIAKNGLTMSDYMLKAKTLSDHLATTGEIIPESGLVMYILNGLGPRYLIVLTTFNMTKICPSIRTFHNQLKNYEKMLLVSRWVYEDYIMQENVTHFNHGNHVSKSNNNKFDKNSGSQVNNRP